MYVNIYLSPFRILGINNDWEQYKGKESANLLAFDSI